MVERPSHDVTLEWWWPWLTDVVIPSAGVLASTAVAVIAIVLATRDRRADKGEQRVATRSEFAELLRQFARDAVRGYENRAMILEPSTDLKGAAARQTPPLTAAVEWVRTHASDTLKMRGGGLDADVFLDTALARIDEWETTGQMDLTELERRPPG